MDDVRVRRHGSDYIDRTIETVRVHRESENSWPQWANIFADEIEDLRAELATARESLRAEEAKSARLARDREVLLMRNAALQDKLLGLDTSAETLAGLTDQRKRELVDGMVRLADDLEAGVLFWQDFPSDLVRRLRAAMGAPAKYDHEKHEWVGQCPYGDLCSACDALGYCTREVDEPS